MRDLGFGTVPSGQALADRLGEPRTTDRQPAAEKLYHQLAERNARAHKASSLPAQAATETTRPQGGPAQAAEADLTEPPAQAASAADPHAYGHVFGGLEWAITGQVALVEIPKLVDRFEADLDPFIERIKRIDRPALRLVDARPTSNVVALIGARTA